MGRFRFWWSSSFRHHVDQQHATAQQELKKSKAMLAEDRAAIVKPLREADQRNHFSDIIRDALGTGYGTPEGRAK